MANLGSPPAPFDPQRLTSNELARLRPEDVVSAYLLILGRRPESEATIALQCALPSLHTLGERLIRSSEFRNRYLHELLPQPTDAPGGPAGGTSSGVIELCTVDLSATGGAEPVLGPGWGRGEAEGRWTSGGASELRLPAGPAHEEYLLRLELRPYRRPRLLEVQAAGVTVLRELVRAETVIMLRVPGELVAADRTLTLRLVNHQPERPCDVSPPSKDDRALAFWLRRVRLEAVDRSEPPLLATAIAPAFESLGERCDFGSFETAINNEPLSLFRYNSVPLAALITAIENRLEGFPRPGAVSLRLARDCGFVVEEASIGLVGHVGIKRQTDIAVDEAALLRAQTARLGFLKRLLNQRLDGDGTIFVYRAFVDEPLGAVLPVWRALRRRGRNALLWVSDADETRPCGTVERLEDGLLRGTIDPALEGSEPGSPRMLAWAILCRRAWRLWPGHD